VLVVPSGEPIPNDPLVSDLRLVVAPATGTGEQTQTPKFVSAGPFRDVKGLKDHVAKTFRVQVKDMTLFFQNQEGPRSQRLELLDDAYSLKQQGVRSGAAVVCQLAAWDPPVSKLGDSAYYAWSRAREAVPDEIRIQKCGPPVQLASHPSAAPGGAAGAGAPRSIIRNYSWVDESRRVVKVYISADGEPAAVAAAGGGGEGRIRATFQEQSFQVDVAGDNAAHSLSISALEHKISPEGCKVKVVEGKRIVVTLQKAKEDSLWNTLVRRA